MSLLTTLPLGLEEGDLIQIRVSAFNGIDYSEYSDPNVAGELA